MDKIPLHKRDELCAFAVLNNSGKCIACCAWNQIHNYKIDCMENKNDIHDIARGKEIPLMMGRRINEV
jgi:hypothetical protein